jgi:hypothetical protein
MNGPSGDQQPTKATRVSDLDCMLLYYAGTLKAILLFLAKIGLELSTLVKPS